MDGTTEKRHQTQARGLRVRRQRMGRYDSMCPDMEVWKCTTYEDTVGQRGDRGGPDMKGLRSSNSPWGLWKAAGDFKQLSEIITCGL